MKPEIDIATGLKTWRAKHQLSQSQAAARLNIPVKTLQNWEIRRSKPRGLALAALQKIIAK